MSTGFERCEKNAEYFPRLGVTVGEVVFAQMRPVIDIYATAGANTFGASYNYLRGDGNDGSSWSISLDKTCRADIKRMLNFRLMQTVVDEVMRNLSLRSWDC